MADDIPAGDPRYDGFRITEAFAFCAVDPADNQEGVPAFSDGSGVVFPMVGFDRRRIDSLRPVAQRMARETGRRLVLKRFVLAEEEEVIEP